MANKIYAAPETAVTFKDSGGSAVITLQNLATTAGRISARYDRGAGSLPRRYYWKFVFQTASAPAVGQGSFMWIVESDGTYADDNYGTADAAVTVFPRRRLLDWNWVTSASSGYNFIRSGITRIAQRYFSIIVQNGTSVSFTNTANVSYVTFIPVPEEVQ